MDPESDIRICDGKFNQQPLNIKNIHLSLKMIYNIFATTLCYGKLQMNLQGGDTD